MNKDELWQALLGRLKAKKMDTVKVERAFALANELHKKQVRKDGTPYITHPLAVATILEKLNFDADVICSALLHDVVEDCGYTINEMREEFGDNVAEIVDSVSAIDKSKYVYDNNNIYESEDFVKFSSEEQTFKKLVALGKKNPLGLYVKFADRLHNLTTIETFEKSKQLEKVKETERWVLPLARALNSRYFYDEIKNACFKITENKDAFFFEQYNQYHKYNDEKVMNNANLIKEILSLDVFSHVYVSKIREYQVYNELIDKNKGLNVNNITQGQIMKASTYKYYLIYTGTIEEAAKEFFSKLGVLENHKIKLIGETLGILSNLPHLLLIDENRNIICTYFLRKQSYFQYRLGSAEGHNFELLDDANTHKIITNYIKVFTKTNDAMFIPTNSTVLDFAFRISTKIGLGFKYAIINGSKTKQPPHTVLKENDKVEVVVDRNKFNEIIPNPELKWFAYVETDNAKRVLINYFEKELEKLKQD